MRIRKLECKDKFEISFIFKHAHYVFFFRDKTISEFDLMMDKKKEEMGTIAEQFAQYRALKDKVRKEKERWEP